MTRSRASVLTINAGSSSVKFAVHEAGKSAALRGKLDRIGIEGSTLSWNTPGQKTAERPVDASTPEKATAILFDWFDEQQLLSSITAVGHRVVHGLERTAPVRITPDVVSELRRAAPYAPEHLPREIEVIEAFGTRHPQLPQFACFDTAFHAGLPRVARQLPLPRRYYDKGIHRYGFHGLSYEYLMEELTHTAGERAARGRIVLAHLGNGSSLAAVKDGRSVDTTMGFTPAAGLVMSTRTGDLDPGVFAFLTTTERMTAAEFDRMVNHESGLLGVSEISSDMRDLLAREGQDSRAAEAVALFCYQAKKWLGAFAAALGGLDTLVFSAGIGERSAVTRARICDGLRFLGIELDDGRNQAHEQVISKEGSRVTVRVIPTDEELMIARSVFRLLDTSSPEQERRT